MELNEWSMNSPYHRLLKTKCCPNNIIILDYYIKSIVLGYWNLSRLFSYQMELNSMIDSESPPKSPIRADPFPEFSI